MGVLRFLCRVGLHNWSTFRVGNSVSAGFMTETPVSEICRRCGDTRHYNCLMLGAQPELSKDSDMWKTYRERRGDGYVAD